MTLRFGCKFTCHVSVRLNVILLNARTCLVMDSTKECNVTSMGHYRFFNITVTPPPKPPLTTTLTEAATITTTTTAVTTTTATTVATTI